MWFLTVSQLVVALEFGTIWTTISCENMGNNMVFQWYRKQVAKNTETDRNGTKIVLQKQILLMLFGNLVGNGVLGFNSPIV
jgi:hypothetical protein